MGQESFPGAEGYGADASGGRGGRVVRVTSSADDGTGSLRWALEDVKGPRTVVFEVNEVRLDDNIDLRNGDVTIAGQSAGGVQVTGATIAIHDDNVIMRGMMFRPGDGAAGHDPGNRDALTIASVRDVIVDHNSIEWGVDENVDIYKHVSDLTFSNNIVAEPLSNSIHPKGEHSKNMLIAGSGGKVPEYITIVDNLFAYAKDRNIRIVDADTLDFANNYIFGVGDQYRSTYTAYEGSTTNVNIVKNLYEAGPETIHTDSPHIKIGQPGTYVSGNLQFDKDGDPIEPQTYGLDPAKRPGALISVTLREASEVRDHVLANAGANPSAHDEVDQRIIDQVTARRGGLVDSVREAGGRGSRPAFKAPADADDDGMPDWFEDDYGFDKRRDDANGDSDRDGYTNIEEYLNGLYTGFDLPGATTADKPEAAKATAPDDDKQPASKPADPKPADRASAEPDSDLLVYLVDTDTDRRIAEVQDGETIKRSLVADRLVGLEVAPQGDLADRVGSIALDFEDGLARSLENFVPYAVFGDRNGNFHDGIEFDRGSYTLEIEVFSGKGGSGVLLAESELTFDI